MKRLTLAILLLAALCGGCLANAHHARRMTGTMIGQLQQAQRLVEAGQWQEAEGLTERAVRCWGEHRFYRYVMLNHNDTDQIARGLSAVSSALAQHDQEQYSAACARLMLQLHFLSEMEQPTLTNIL